MAGGRVGAGWVLDEHRLVTQHPPIVAAAWQDAEQEGCPHSCSGRQGTQCPRPRPPITQVSSCAALTH